MKNADSQGTSRKISLTERVIALLRDEIEGGSLLPGSALPTEPMLIKKFGVSRTVVREAIAALKAEGLLEPRQGSGVFVLPSSLPKQDGLIFTVNNGQISDILEILELRMAVEIEGAGLACERCSVAQQAKIYEALQKMKIQIEQGGLAGKADYQFHQAIADATNNRRYGEFLEFLGDKTIPREQLPHAQVEDGGKTAYLSRIMDEHHHIYDAIAMRDANKARQAMREHLSRSQACYRNLLLSLSSKNRL